MLHTFTVHREYSIRSNSTDTDWKEDCTPDTSASGFAKILGIDEYVARLVSDAVDKAIKRSSLKP